MAVTIPEGINLNRQVQRALQAASEALGGEISVEGLKWRFSKGLCLQAAALSLKGTALPGATLCIARVHVYLALWPLLRGRLHIRKLELEQPVLKWRYRSKSAVDEADTGATRSTRLPALIIDRLHIAGGSLFLDFGDRLPGPRSLDIHSICISVFHASASTVAPFEFSAMLGQSGTISGDGQLAGVHAPGAGAQLRLHCALDNIDAAAVTARSEQGEGGLEGYLAGHLRFTSDLNTDARLQGELDLSCIRYRDDARWENPLASPSSRLTWLLERTGPSLTLHRLSLHVADLCATLQLTIDDWRGQATVRDAQFSGELPARTLLPLIPWRQLGATGEPLRAVMALGGTISARTLSLPTLRLTGQRPALPDLFEACEAELIVTDMVLPGAGLRPRLRVIDGTFLLAQGSVRSDCIRTRTGAVSLPRLSLQADHLLDQPRLRLSAQGPAVVDDGGPGSGDEALIHWGIRELTGAADVTIHADFNRARSDALLAEGSINIQGLRILTAKSGSRLGLDGVIEIGSSGQRLLRFDHCRASVNDAPLELHGQVRGNGPADLLVDLTLLAKNLTLSPLAEVIPPLALMQLAGTLNADLNLSFAATDTDHINLQGRLDIDDLAVQRGALSIFDGKVRATMQAKRVVIERADCVLNGQTISLRGNVSELPRLVAAVHVSSPEIDVDHLLSLLPTLPDAEIAAGDDAPGHALRVPKDAELSLSVAVEQGWYRAQRFDELVLAAKFNGATLEGHSFDVRIADGRLHTRGSADLSDLDRITFDARYAIKDARLEKLLALIYDEPPIYRGQASSRGNLQGVLGKRFMDQPRGSIIVKAGPGHLPRASALGEALYDAMAFARLKGLLTGSMRQFSERKRVPFDHFYLQGQFAEQRFDIASMVLNTPGVKTDWKGVVNLPDNSVEIDVEVSLLGGLDTALELVPMVGSTANKMSRIYLHLSGPLHNLKVEKTLWNSLEDVRKRPLQTLEKSVGKSLDTFKKFWQ